MIDLIDSVGASALFLTQTALGVDVPTAYHSTVAAIVGCAIWRGAYRRLLAYYESEADNG